MTGKATFLRGLFVVSVLCFFLPFVSVSCNGKKVASITGLQLATGATVEEPQMFGPSKPRHVGAEPLASLALFLAVASFCLSCLHYRKAIGSAISASVGALCMLLLKLKMDADIMKAAHGMFNLDYEAGYIITLLALVSGAVMGFYIFAQARTEPVQGSAGHAGQAGATNLPASLVCPRCRVAVTSGEFCASCGERVIGSA